MKNLGLVAVLQILFGVVVTADQRMNAQDEAAIRRAIGTLESGWNSHNMETYMSVLSADANFVNVNGWWWQGHDEIEKAHVAAHQTTYQFSKAEVPPKKIRLLKPDIAVAQTAWKIFGDVRNPAARDYMMTMVLRKQNGRWLITDAQNGSAEDRSTSSLTPNLSTEATFQSSGGPVNLGAARGEEAVRQMLGQVDQLWSKGDIQRVSRFYAQDADVIDTKARWHQGRQQIENYLSDFRDSTFKDGQYTSEVAKLAVLYPDVAVATIRWRAMAGSQQQFVKGMGIVVLERNRQEWRIVATQNTISRGNAPATRN